MAFLVLAFPIALPAQPGAALVIRIYDRTDLSEPGFAKISHEITSIYRSAGSTAEVRLCQGDNGCPEPFGVNEVGIRIPDSMGSAKLNELGMAFTSRGGNLGTVYGSRVRKAAERAGADPDRVLAYVIAHEVAHLFGLRHGVRGVMQDGWRDADYRAMAEGRVNFTRREGELLRLQLAANRSGNGVAAK